MTIDHVAITAIYDGDCKRCPRRIQPGQQIVHSAEGYIHLVCAPKEICPKCFMAKANNGKCVCDDDD